MVSRIFRDLNEAKEIKGIVEEILCCECLLEVVADTGGYRISQKVTEEQTHDREKLLGIKAELGKLLPLQEFTVQTVNVL